MLIYEKIKGSENELRIQHLSSIIYILLNNDHSKNALFLSQLTSLSNIQVVITPCLYVYDLMLHPKELKLRMWHF